MKAWMVFANFRKVRLKKFTCSSLEHLWTGINFRIKSTLNLKTLVTRPLAKAHAGIWRLLWSELSERTQNEGLSSNQKPTVVA